MILAASPMWAPSAPKSWMPMGRCDSSILVYLLFLSHAWRMPSAETNSVTITSAPSSLQMVRKMGSVTPAMGARNSGKSVLMKGRGKGDVGPGKVMVP